MVSPQFDTRIDQWGDEVGNEIAENDGKCRYDRDTHDDGNVDALECLPCKLADAGPTEHAFNDDDARHEKTDIDANHGDDRQDGIDIGLFMAGIVVVESVFGWPGIGQLAWQAIQRVDIPIIMGVTIISAFAIVLGNLIADLITPLIDPRIKLR